MNLIQKIQGIFSKSQARTDDTIRYPQADDISDLDMRIALRGPPWIRTEIGEVVLNSNKIAVYSLILVHGPRPPRKEMVQIEGYKLNRRKVKRFDEDEKEKATSEIREKIQGNYNMKRFERIYCI